MAMPIGPNEKFACFAYNFYGLGDDMPDEVQLGPRLWAFKHLDLDLPEHWIDWMGSIKMDALKDAAFVMLATAPSAKPEVLDQDNLDLARTLDYLLYGILLQGVPNSRQGFSLTGANIKGEINVRQFSDLRDYQPTFDMPPFRVGLAGLKHAAWLADRLREVNTGGHVYCGRLRRGLSVLLDGTRLLNRDGDRLHQFVRAIEALIKPEIAKTRAQFAHRISQTFTLANDETRGSLLQLFDLRSYVEHMHLVHDALQGDEAMRIAIVNRRTRQIDILARTAFLRIMNSDALLAAFRTDTDIDAFWQMTDAQRVALWGARLDIRAQN